MDYNRPGACVIIAVLRVPKMQIKHVQACMKRVRIDA